MAQDVIASIAIPVRRSEGRHHGAQKICGRLIQVAGIPARLPQIAQQEIRLLAVSQGPVVTVLHEAWTGSKMEGAPVGVSPMETREMPDYGRFPPTRPRRASMEEHRDPIWQRRSPRRRKRNARAGMIDIAGAMPGSAKTDITLHRKPGGIVERSISEIWRAACASAGGRWRRRGATRPRWRPSV